MIKNLLVVAIRNFRRDIGYSLLNLFGLVIGITFSLFLIFYVKDELNYDRYHEKADRIYRIGSEIKEADKPPMKIAITQVPLAAALRKDYPEVEESTRFITESRTMYKKGELHLYEDNIFYADSNIFRVFTYPFIEGNPRTALVAPHSMVLTESAARKFFPAGVSPVGQSLENSKGEVFKITGLVKDVPGNSHIRFDVLLSASTLPVGYSDNWGNFNHYTYVLLKPHTDAAVFEKKLVPMYDKYMAAIFSKFNVKIHYVVQPITSIHLHSDMQFEREELGSMSYIYIFLAVAFFMLIIACINYMNLTTARSARRAKEIGVRKVTGSTQGQLVAQFLLESMMTALLALLLSIGCVAALLHPFNELAGKSITFGAVLQGSTLFILLGIVLFVGFVGGSYPALYLSKFDPIQILKGKLSKGSSNVSLRQVLVVTQFSIAMIMLICTIVVYKQLNFLRKVDMGFNKAQVATVTVNTQKDVGAQILAFRNEVRKDPHVLSASTSQTVPGGPPWSLSLYSVETKGGFVDKGIENYGIDEDYFKTLGMQVKNGRAFTGLADTLRRVIVNESFARAFGWDDPIGKRIKRSGDTSGNYSTVVGVVKDFNQKSLYNPISPLLLYYSPNNQRIQLKLDGQDITATVERAKKVWHTIFADLPFEYSFLDQDFDSQYAADQRRGKLFTAFSAMTIGITCLGLLGLIAFTTQQRQKELSVRKVLGAGVGQLVTLITRNFVALVGISCLIAFPVAWLFMNKWLKIFPYNTGLSAGPFFLAAVGVLLITLLTVIFHTMRAALANPSKSLRSE